MSKKEKLIARLRSKPKDFTFNEADSLMGSLGMEKSSKGKTSGSSVSYTIGDARVNLHKPHPRNELKRYQIDDIISKLEQEGLI